MKTGPRTKLRTIWGPLFGPHFWSMWSSFWGPFEDHYLVLISGQYGPHFEDHLRTIIWSSFLVNVVLKWSSFLVNMVLIFRSIWSLFGKIWEYPEIIELWQYLLWVCGPSHIILQNIIKSNKRLNSYRFSFFYLIIFENIIDNFIQIITGHIWINFVKSF
jgi:hypothetical protein